MASDQQINDFSITGYGEKGKKTWELSGQSADIMESEIKLKEVTGKVYGKQEDVTLTADTGNFDKNQGKVRLEKDVVITSSGGTKLTTDYLTWDRNQQTVMTEAMVNIEKDNMVTTATGATCKTDLNKVNLEKDVKVEIQPPKEAAAQEFAVKDKIVITCEGPMEIDYAKNIAIFNKNVKVSQKDVNLYSDTMEVYFITSDEKDATLANKTDEAVMSPVSGGRIDKIIAKGNVKIERGENVSYSEEAVFTAADKKVVLLGKPRLVFYSQEDMNAAFGN